MLNCFVVAAQLDIDGDGMDDAWETANQLDPNDPTDAWCDYDNDQILNLFEFQLKTDPNAFASPPIRYFTPQNTQEEFTELMNSGIGNLAVIRMSEGTYNLFYNINSSGGLIALSDYKIMIQGGWNAAFTEYNPFQYSTIFDGQDSRNILVLDTRENREVTFILEGVEITNAGNGVKEAAVECIDWAGTGKFSFYNCSFYNNGYGNDLPTNSGMALGIFWTQEMVNGNFFLVNTSIVNNRNGLYGQLSSFTTGNWYIINSTLTNATQSTVFEIEGTSQIPNAISIDAVNSIFWEDSIDFPIQFPAALNTQLDLAYSNIDEIENIDLLLDLNIDNATVTTIVPEFIDTTIAHFELQNQSPLKESGLNVGLPFDGLLPDIGVNQKTNSPIKIDTTILPPTCLGNDGSIEIIPLDALGGLTFSLNDIDFQDEFKFSNLDAGSYVLYVRRDATCQRMQLPFNLEEMEQQLREEIASFCKNEGYTLPDGMLVTEPGIYNSLVTNNENCEVLIQTTLTLNENYETTITKFVCNGDDHTLPNGITVNEPGMYVSTLQTAEGCDSVINTNLNFPATLSLENEINICPGQTYTLEDGSTVSMAGVYIVELADVFGCLNTYQTTISIDDVFQTTEEVAICETQTYTLPNGIVVAEVGMYETTLQSTQGCDSIVITNLSINPTPIIQNAVSICEGGSYILEDGSTISEAGNYSVDLIDDITGCITTFETTITIDDAFQTTEEVTICEGQTYTLPDGTVTIDAGMYTSILQSTQGCDSLIITNISINPTPIIQNAVSICEGGSYILEDGSTISEAGNYSVDLINDITGCITTFETTITIDDAFQTTQNIDICEGQTYSLPDGTVTTDAGMYETTLQSTQGCDSIIITDITITPNEVIQNSVNICIGHTHTLEDGTVVSSAGPYSVDIVGPDGCITTYNTIVNTSQTINFQEADICEEGTYILPDGIEVNEAGRYTSILEAVNGCDSTIRTEVSVIPKRTIQYSISNCKDTPHTLEDGTIVSEVGTYTVEAVNPTTGCPAIFITSLDFIDAFEREWSEYICDNETHILPDGREVSTSGIYENNFISTQGCDSIIIINLIVKSALPIEKEVSICNGTTFMLKDGTIVSEAGIYTFDFVDEKTKCKVSHTVTVNIEDELRTTEEVSICEGQAYYLPNGLEVSEPNIYESILQSTQGCDSIITTNLSINPTPIIQNAVSICEGGRYMLEDGTTISEAGNYSIDLTDNNTGCITTYETIVNISEVFQTIEAVTICQGETYRLPDGRVTNLPGNYESILQSTQGCDSIIVTNLNTSTIEINIAEEFILLLDAVELSSTIQSTNPLVYLWSPPTGLSCVDCQQPVAIINESTDYLLEVTDTISNCKATASVSVIKKKPSPVVPTAFSPNNDGINDYFIPLNINADTQFLFMVFNRWGQKLYETQSIDQPWDGFYNNEKQPIGVYTWYFQYEEPNGGTKQVKGNVTLVR